MKALKAIGKILLMIIVANLLVMLIASIPIHGKNYARGFNGDTSKSGIIDDKDLFDAKEEKRLTALIQEYSEKLEMNILVYVSGTQKISDWDTQIFADDSYDKIFGEDTDGVFFYLDFSGKKPAYDYLSTSGKAFLIYEKNIDNILDYPYRYLPSSSSSTIDPAEISKAIEAFCIGLEVYNKNLSDIGLFEYQMDSIKKKYVFCLDGEMYVTKTKAPGVRMILLRTASFIGILIAVIIYYCTKSGYKFKKSLGSGVYLSREKTNFTEKTDTFIRSYVTKHRIDTSSGGGGGGRSHGGGSHHSHGGAHGGGGRHR